MAKDKNKKPFNVLSKKGFATLALAGVMAVSPFALAGCGEKGDKGDTGAAGAAGKSAYELAVENGFTGTVQEWLASLKGSAGKSVVSVIKTATNGLVDTYTITFSDGTTTTFDVTNGADGGIGPQGPEGPQGPQGNPGKDGISVYIGYDGYIWQGTERTTFKLENSVVDETIAENTLGLYGNKYFTENLVSTSNPIALMSNYFPTIKKTGYSGTQVSEITIYTDKAGTLEIGTAKVEDIVNARTNGTTLTTTTTAHTVVAGLNKITLDLAVADTDTLVIGGGTSDVNVYTYEVVNGADEYGFHTICDNVARSELFEETNDVKDKLVIKVKASELTEATNLVQDWETVQSSADPSKHSGSYQIFMPFAYSDTTLFENCNITKLSVYVGDTLMDSAWTIDTTKTYTYTLSVINSSSVVAGSKYNVLRSYTLEVLGSELTQNKWYEFDLSDLGIQLEEGETLGFGGTADTLPTDYYSAGALGCSYVGYTSATDTTLKLRANFGLLIGVEGCPECSYEQHLTNLYEEEQEALLKNS